MSDFFRGHESQDAYRARLQREIDGIEPKIRARLLRKYPHLRRGAYDMDDVMSSTRRRVDAAAKDDCVRAAALAEFEAYVHATARRIAIDNVRRDRREQKLERMMRDLATQRSRSEPTVSTPIERQEIIRVVMRTLPDADHAAMDLWLRGQSHRRIAASLGIPLARHRTRWRRVQVRLRRLSHEGRKR